MGRCGLSNATSTGSNTIHSEKTPGKLGATDSRAATVLSSLETAPPLHTTGSGHRPQSRALRKRCFPGGRDAGQGWWDTLRQAELGTFEKQAPGGGVGEAGRRGRAPEASPDNRAPPGL